MVFQKRIDKQVVRELEIQLIIEVKKNECLYAKNVECYRDKDIRNAAWRNIARRLGVTVQETQRKWNSLRDSFRAYVRAKRNSPNGKFTVKWVHFKSMQFLMPHIRPCEQIKVKEHVPERLELLRSENNYSKQNVKQNIDSDLHIEEYSIHKEEQEEMFIEPYSPPYLTTTPAITHSTHSFEQPQPEPECIETVESDDNFVPASLLAIVTTMQKTQEVILKELKESNRHKVKLLNLEKDKLEEQKMQNFEINKQAYINIELKRKELELYALKIKMSCSNCNIKNETELE